MFGLAIGVFDGVHNGHFKVIDGTLEYCRKNDLEPAVMTFYPNKKGVAFQRLAVLLDNLQGMGIHNFFVVGLRSQVYKMGGYEFLLYLKDLGVSAVFVGEDFVFGKDRAFGISFLKENLSKYGIKLNIIELVKVGEEKISTSKFKSFLEQKDFESLKALYNSGFYVKGIVIKGRRFGTKKTGFKTANLKLENQLLPPNGVYITKTELDGIVYNSLSYVGKSPVLKQETGVLVETHILNHEFPDLYGKRIKVEFIDFLRKELTNVDKNDLIRQIKVDVSKAINSNNRNRRFS